MASQQQEPESTSEASTTSGHHGAGSRANNCRHGLRNVVGHFCRICAESHRLYMQLSLAERAEYEGEWRNRAEFRGLTDLVSVAVPIEFVDEVKNFVNMLMAMDYVSTHHRSILIHQDV